MPRSLQKNPKVNQSKGITAFDVADFGNELNEPLNVLHPSGLVVDEYMRLTHKVFYSIREIYLKHVGKYDWYLKADLDTFVHINNLREFLRDKNPASPSTFGYDFKVIVDGGYHSGKSS